MPDSTPFRTLTAHFTRMLYAAGADGSQTSVVRTLAGVATPMLMAAFWIVTLATWLNAWSAAAIHYLFVLYSVCAMACVTALQWERLFPTRADFLILLPLPIRPQTLFSAKLTSSAAFLGMFLLATNIFGTVLFPMLYGTGMLRVMLAHAIAVFTAGLAASLAVLTVEALVIVLVPEGWFRRIAPLVQTIIVASALTLFLRIATVDEQLPLFLTGRVSFAGKLPPLWFVSLYETLLHGPTATPFAHQMAHCAWLCLPILTTSTIALYPAAWKRRQRMALEGARSASLRHNSILHHLLHHTLLPHADQRAIFHFLSQTLARLNRYHVMLAAYSGSGIALAFAVSVTLNTHDTQLQLALDARGVHEAVAILLFWTIAGLRVAFLLPEELRARWIFQMAPLSTTRVVTTMKRFVMLACIAVMAVFLATLAACHWSTADILRQACLGIAVATLLVDLFFFQTDSIPFTRPSQPERSSLPLTLAIYLFGVPVLELMLVALERWIGTSIVRLGISLLCAAGVHTLFHIVRRLPSHAISNDPFLGETDSDVRTLGLSA